MRTRAVISFPIPAAIQPVTPAIIADLIANRLFNGRPSNSVSLTRQDVKDLILTSCQAAIDHCPGSRI